MDFTVLRTLRKAQGLTLKDVSKKVGIARGYLSLIERNKKSPNIQVIEDICDYVKCELRIIHKN